jgi:hypothetical protein
LVPQIAEQVPEATTLLQLGDHWIAFGGKAGSVALVHAAAVASSDEAAEQSYFSMNQYAFGLHQKHRILHRMFEYASTS